MLIDSNTDCGFVDENESCYEAVASQEEIYLEETEEEVRLILISDNLTQKELDGKVSPTSV